MRRMVLLVCLIAIPLLYSCARSNSPNVLLIVADDLGVNDVSYLGGAIDTPNIDSIAKQSLRFRRHYADSTCSPSRVALISGSYPARLGFLPTSRGISRTTPTLPRTLADGGYRNYHIGKWHMGHSTAEARPLGVGFDHSFVYFSQWLLSGERNAKGDAVPGQPRYVDPWLSVDDKESTLYPGHLTDILTSRAIEAIEQTGDAPWFINLWYSAPHYPIQPSEDFIDDASPKGKYAALVRQLDHNIGRIIQHLQATGEIENTIIVFVSDNGGTSAASDSNAPFYGKKASFREGGVRTPMFIHYPKAVTSRDVTTIASIMDIYPTLAAMLGLPVPKNIDGVDLLADDVAPRSLFWETNLNGLPSYSVLSEDGKWRLNEGYKMTTRVKSELYDLQAEPSAKTNVLSKHLMKAKELRSEHKTWHKQVHRLQLASKVSDTGHRRVEGDDMQRSPHDGGWSFAVAVTSARSEEPAPAVIGIQPSVWKLAYHHQAGQLDLQLGSWKKSFPARLDDACHSLTVSASFTHRRTNWAHDDDSTNVSIFVDGTTVGTAALDEAVDAPEHLHEPTYIGQLPDGGQPFKGRISEPIFANIKVNEDSIWGPKDMHETMCAELVNQQ